MPRITPIHWREFEKYLLSVGCRLVRERGDHRVYQKDGLKRPLVIPKKNDLGIDIIKNNLRVLGIDHDDYINTMNRL